MPNAVIDLTEGLPERTLAAGDVVFSEGEPSATVVVLIEGELLVEAGGVAIDRHVAPGTVLGETGALLGQVRSATVTAGRETVIRDIGHPDEFFAAHPGLGVEVARQLAGRLHRLISYIVDVEQQFADRDDHMGVFGELLTRLASRPLADVDIEPGSDRSPDY